jgi:hypothetical protein
MEELVSNPLLPEPHKMLENIPAIIRSRLQSWITKKLLSAMEIREKTEDLSWSSMELR